MHHEIGHLVKMMASQELNASTPFYLCKIIAYDPTTNSVQVEVPFLRNPDGLPVVSDWIKWGRIGSGDGSGYQYYPKTGELGLIEAIEDSEGYWVISGGFYFYGQAVTPFVAFATHEANNSSVIDQKDLGDPPLDAVPAIIHQSHPGDTIIRHASGHSLRFNLEEVLLMHKTGSSIRMTDDGNVWIQAKKSIHMLAGDQITGQCMGELSFFSNQDAGIHTAGTLNITAQNEMNVQIQKDILFTTAEGAMTISALQKGIQVTAGTDIELTATDNIKADAGSDIDLTANLIKSDSTDYQVWSQHQVYGFQGHTDDIHMYAPIFEAIGVQTATLSGTTVNIGSDVGSIPARAKTINIIANKGLDPNTNTDRNFINIRTDGPRGEFNQRADHTRIRGDSDTHIFGFNIVIGEDMDGRTDVNPNTIAMRAIQVDIAAVNMAIAGNYDGHLNNAGGHLNLLAPNSYVLSYAKDLYGFAVETSVYHSNTDAWLSSGSNTYILGGGVQVGISTDTHIPTPHTQNIDIVTASQTGMFQVFTDDGKINGQGLGTAANSFEIRSINTTIDVDGNNIEAVILAAAMTIFNEHTHPISGGGDTEPPSQQWDDTCVSICLFAESGGGGFGG